MTLSGLCVLACCAHAVMMSSPWRAGFLARKGNMTMALYQGMGWGMGIHALIVLIARLSSILSPPVVS